MRNLTAAVMYRDHAHAVSLAFIYAKNTRDA
jgi:hypothetical protein